MTTAIYPGSFNPFHNGHFQVVRDLSDIFDNVVILIARNGDKETAWEFTEERAPLAKAAIQKDVSEWSDKITVEILPCRSTLASYLNDFDGSYVLARGVRDTNDCASEIRFFDTVQDMGASINDDFILNRVLVPAWDSVKNISSSLVRSIIGLDGWTKMLKEYVPVNVGRMIIDSNFEAFMTDMWDRAVKGLDGVLRDSAPRDCLVQFNKLQSVYVSRSYHNWTHVYNCLLELWAADLDFINTDDIMAIFWHDYVYDVLKSDNEERSAEECLKFLETIGTDEVDASSIKESILATKEGLSGSSLVRDVDRSILAAPWDIYSRYVDNLFCEIEPTLSFDRKMYLNLRKEWITKTLASKDIYTTFIFQSDKTAEARANLNRELESINKELNE